ncbi:RNA-directed RNA polymerase [Bertholletia excelsa]
MGENGPVSGFPALVAADSVKNFLERITGRGTVDALEVRQPKKAGSRAYAKVQFTTERSAELLLGRSRIWYGSSFYLKTYRSDVDLVQKPKAYALEMEDVRLYVGCQISREKFSVFWTSDNVSVKFGFGLRKLYFSLSHLSDDYKLELSYENIWQTELRTSPGRTSRFLVIQLMRGGRTCWVFGH